MDTPAAERGVAAVAQNGFHGAFGLLAGPPLASGLSLRGPARRTFLTAFVAGNLIPDADWVALVMVWLHDRELALAMHRSFTHSLLGAALPALGLGLAGRWIRDRRLVAAGLGFSLGILAHIALDLFFWFEGVDLLWPLGHWGLPSRVNLWWWFHTPPLLGRLLAAADYLAYGVFYALVARRLAATGPVLRMAQALERLQAAMAAATAAAVALALALPDAAFNPIHYGFWAVVAFPTALYYTLTLGHRLDAPAPRPRERTGPMAGPLPRPVHGPTPDPRQRRWGAPRRAASR